MSSRRSLFVFHKLTMMLDPWQCKRNRSQQKLLPQQESLNTLLVCVAPPTARPLLPCLAWTTQLFIHGPWFSVHELNAILDDDYVFQFPVCSFTSVNRHIETGNGKRIDERCDFIIHPFRACGGAGGTRMARCCVCCLFLSLCLRATNALCCSNPFASLVFLVRFRSWAAQVSVAEALPVSPLQNLAFWDLFLRYYRSVLFVFAPAVCFFFFLFCFIYILFRRLWCCYLSHMPLNNGYNICFYLFGLSTVRCWSGFFFPRFVVSATAVWFFVLYSMGKICFEL